MAMASVSVADESRTLRSIESSEKDRLDIVEAYLVATSDVSVRRYHYGQ
jgi:hypothetical protein